MKRTQEKKQMEKGQYGYIKRRIQYEIAVSFVGFAIIAGIYFLGILLYKNNRNIFTVLAVMFVLPIAKHVVAVLVLLGKKSLSMERWQELEVIASKKQGVFLYDNVISSKEKLHCFPVIYVENKHVFVYHEKGEKREWETYITQFLSSVALVEKVWGRSEWAEFLKRVRAADYVKVYEKLTELQKKDRKDNDEKILQSIKDYSL